MSTILLSFTPDWFEYLEKGIKKYEYRRHFPTGETTAYFYVSNPVKAITGIAHFGERQLLSSGKNKVVASPKEVIDHVNDNNSGCRFAVPCLSFQPTNKIPLNTLRADVPGFIVPRMYYYIDDSDLLHYLQSNLRASGPKIEHLFCDTPQENIY